MRSVTPPPNLPLLPDAILRKALSSIIGFLNASRFESNVVLLVGYFLAGEATLQLPHLVGRGVEIWPPAGIAIAAFLLRGSAAGPFIFAAAFLVDAFATGSIGGALCMAAGQTLEGWLGARILSRGLDTKFAFYNLQSVIRLSLVAAPLAAAVCSTISTLTSLFLGTASSAELGPVWLTFWQGDVIGAIVVTPVLVLIVLHYRHALDFAESAELLFLMSACIALCIVISSRTPFLAVNAASLKFLFIPIFIWMGLRFCPMEIAIVNAIVAGFAVWNGFQNSVLLPADRIPLHLMSLVVAVVSTSTLALAAVVAERRQADEALLLSSMVRNEQFQADIHELNKIVDSHCTNLAAKSIALKLVKSTKLALIRLLDDIPEVVRVIDLSAGKTLHVSEAFETLFGRPLESFRQEPHSWLQAVHPEDHDRVSSLFYVGPSRVLRGAFDIEYRILRPDNSVRWLRDRGVFIRDELGTVERLVAVASDVTEFKNLCRSNVPLGDKVSRSRQLSASTCYIYHRSSS